MTNFKATVRRLSIMVGVIALTSALGAPVRADPAVQASVTRWNAIWEPGSDGRPAVHGWTAANLLQKNAEVVGQGFQMISLTHVYLGNFEHRYDAIWKAGTEQTAVVVGFTEAQFLDAMGTYWGQGLRLFRMNRYPTSIGSGTFLYDGIFKPGTDGRRVVWDRSLDEIKSDDQIMRAAGHRLIQIAGTHTDSTVERYHAIWVPGTDARPIVLRATWNELAQATGNLWDLGYRIKYLNIVRTATTTFFYDAIFEPGSDGRPFIVGCDLPCLQAKNAEFWALGYRMTVSQPYTSPS